MRTTIAIIAGLAFACGSYAEEKVRQQAGPKHELQELLHRAREAREAGRHDEARELGEKARHIAQEFKADRRGGDKKRGAWLEKKPGAPMEKKPGAPGEKHMPPQFKGPQGERLHHVMEAIEHLRAAGLHEPAKGIEDIARNLLREMEEHMKHEKAKEPAKEPGKDQPKPQAKEPGKDSQHPMAVKFQSEMEELRQQIRKLAGQIEEMRKETILPPRKP